MANVAMNYGEIYFLGQCNFHCFFCIQKELEPQYFQDTMTKHFTKWPNFEDYLAQLTANHISTIYLSSVNTEPLQYKYVDELTNYLINKGFDVGLRSNGSLALKHIDTINKMKAEVSFSVQSLNPETQYKIAKNRVVPNFKKILNTITNNNVRLTILVNNYNASEIFLMLAYFRKFTNVRCVQLRRLYKYYKNESFVVDQEAFDDVLAVMNKIGERKTDFCSNPVFDYHGLSVSFWSTVFTEDEVHSLNYFTNGFITPHNTLVNTFNNDQGKENH